MKILILSDQQNKIGPMFCGFLNYYVPKNVLVHLAVEKDMVTDDMTAKVMRSTGIETNTCKQVLHTTATTATTAYDYVFNIDALRFSNGPNNNSAPIELSIPTTDSPLKTTDKQLKKQYKALRNEVRDWCESFVEKSLAVGANK